MTLHKEDLRNSSTFPARLRFFPEETRPKTFLHISGAPELAPGTPLAFNTSTGFWEVWSAGAANGVGTIRGFVWPDVVQLHATEEVIGNVMLSGRLHRNDIAVPSGETQNDLDAALQDGDPSLRELGFSVEGLAGVR